MPHYGPGECPFESAFLVLASRSDERVLSQATVCSSDSLPMTWIREYLENVVAEMEKVNWPGRDELISSTLITIVATLIVSGFIFLADQVIQRILEILYRV
ncbi:preprotein translocase, SecE subunit, putative [Salinibacter ruber DSM 13855]|uniref:Protein translocase subunit SecE n=2 Tax=Salinibacter ruber TaxID=146919 RepID=Q2S1P9_SALRD|nr:preprotein translocase, SecE subunit, putative [Salinibacter ruber DSM 13855]